MGSLLISGILIFSIISFYNEEMEDKSKVIIILISFFSIMIICLICNLNIILFLLTAVLVGFTLKDRIYLSRKQFLILTCIATFISINFWGFGGAFILCSFFDYGLFKGFFKAFSSMNSSYEFALELINELLLKYGYSSFSDELHIIQEKLYPELDKLEIIKTILDLFEYL